MIDIIISDVHIGSPFCNYDAFSSFLKALPDDCRLVLNGDILDSSAAERSAEGQRAIQEIAAVSVRIRAVIWVEGNHDYQLVPSALQHLTRVEGITLGDEVYVTHGDGFDRLMARHRWFVKLFRAFHNMRIALGAPSVHVAEYAKKWPYLFNVLRRNVIANAVSHARAHSCAVVSCGHVHHPEHTREDGIEYFNSGSWTESDSYYVVHDGAVTRLVQYTPGDNVPSWDVNRR